jgi:hypothetical protein
MTTLKRLWTASAPLTAVGLAMAPVLAGTLVGLAVDARTVTGAPVWLKPAKFAASIGIYSLTLAWIFSLIPAWARTRRVVGWITAVALALEMVVIAGQAARGVASHFNVATLLDGVLFTIMGAAILVQTFSTIAVAVALWRERLADAALGWALRLGIVITFVGAMTGGLMTRPTLTQLDAAPAGERMLIAGAHTVGAPDGGPGMPGTGWSTTHGDLRVPHFIGLHALQALPLLALALRRRGVAHATRVRLMMATAASYATLFGILLAQALSGESLFDPGAVTGTLLAVWVGATIATIGTAWAAWPHRPARRAIVVREARP